MNEPIVYLSGSMLAASQAHLAVYDAGVVLGATVTEMTRTFNGVAFRLDEHLDRLFRSLRYTQMEIGLSQDELRSISHELIEHNRTLSHTDDELGLIHFVTAGEYPTYAGMAGKTARTTPTVCVHTFPLPFELWAEKMQHGQHLVTPAIRHVPPQCYDPKMKYRSRMHFYLAEKQATAVDPKASALLLDLNGNVTETGGANFLIVEHGAILSPTTQNTLPGVSRSVVGELAQQLDIAFIERDIQPYNVINADEAFTASTPYFIMPVTRFNDQQINDGSPGPIFRQLMTAFSETVGLDVEQQVYRNAERRRSEMTS